MKWLLIVFMFLASEMLFAQCPDTANSAGYVLAAASGTGTGVDWNNAYTSFGTGAGQVNPARMVRGCTYYVGAGNYNLGSQVVFSSPDSGTTLITIQAPTVANHGTATGWLNSFVGQAQWSCLSFTTDYWTLNGSYRSTATGVPGVDWRTGYGFYVYNTNGAGVPLCPHGDSSSISFGAGGTCSNGSTVEYTHIHGSGDTTGTYIDLGIFGACGINPTYQYNYVEKVGSCFFKTFASPTVPDTVLVQYNLGNNDQSTTANHGCGYGLMASNTVGASRTIIARWNLLENVEGTSYWDSVDCQGCHGSMYFYGNILFTNPAEWDGNCKLCVPSTGNQDGLAYHVVELFSETTTPMELTEFLFVNNTIYNIAPAGDASPSGACDWAIDGGEAANITNLYIQNNLYVGCPTEVVVGSLSSGTITCTYNSFFNAANITSECNGNIQTASGVPFVSVTGDNFALTQNTACWTPLQAPYNIDLFGHTRGASGCGSRGALEYNGAPPTQAYPPSFNPGSPYNGVSTTLQMSTAFGSIICYNTTGNPTTTGTSCPAGSTQYINPINITASETVYAIAGGSGISNSIIAQWDGTISGGGGGLPSPTCVPAGGISVNNPNPLCTGPSGATICYTLNGSTPTAPTAGTCPSVGGTEFTYSGAISTITTTPTTLNLISTEVGQTNSTTQSYTFTLTTGTVTCNRAGGSYSASFTVTCSSATTGANVYYTTNGVAATCSGTAWPGSLLISSTTTLMFIACNSGYNNSASSTYAYTITNSVNLYIAQTAAGSGNGSSCANAMAITFFNTTGNWGTGVGQIGPGTVVGICGTITTQMGIHGSGTSTTPIVVQWQSGALLSFCSTTGALAFDSGMSYVIIDLGANAPAITCPSNGSGLSTDINAIGIYGGGGFTNTEIRNGQIGPIYVHSGSDTNVASAGIFLYGGSQNYFHNLQLDWMEKGIHYELGNGYGNSYGNVISYNYCDGTSGVGTTGGCIAYVDGDNAAHTDTGALIHDNSCVLGIGWAGSAAHITCFDFFQQSGTNALDNINNLQIYNNFFTSSNVIDTSAYVELTDGVIGCNANSVLTASIFNNLFVQTGTWTGGDGFIFEHGCYHTDQIYNNTLLNTAATNSVGMSLNGPFDGPPGNNTFILENNIFENQSQFISNVINPSSGSILTANYNIYYNASTTAWYWNGSSYPTLAAWQGITGQDANSSVGNPGLTGSYMITNTSSLAYNFGANLTSAGITALDIGGPQTFGLSGSCGTGCLQRSSTNANWDAGLYPYSGGTQGLANPSCQPVPATYNAIVRFSCTPPSGITYCYTNDGSTPTTSSPGTCGGGTTQTYTAAFNISTNATADVHALATESGSNNSTVVNNQYVLTVATPGCNPGNSSFIGSVTVTCNDGTSGASIFYAVGSTPTCSSTAWPGSLVISATETIELISCYTNFNNSAVATYTYTKGTPAAAPTGLTGNAVLTGTSSVH